MLKDRAKASKVRGLISSKASATDKERGGVQKEADALQGLSTKLEFTDIPLARKENESMKRDIKRQEHELDLIYRKQAQKGRKNGNIADITKSNEKMLLSQHTEKEVSKKAVDELQKAREKLVSEESRDEERLGRIVEVLQVSKANNHLLARFHSHLLLTSCPFWQQEKTNIYEMCKENSGRIAFSCHKSRRNGIRAISFGWNG